MRILQGTKKSLAQNRAPRISTRGYYDLGTGATLRRKRYDVYPKKFFEDLGRCKEFTIMVHGMRNDKSGALTKLKIARARLRHLGYAHPVVGFSYDSNVRNAHLVSYEAGAVKVAKVIARKNGWHLAQFVLDFKKINKDTRIRLMGHSLGSEVILHAVSHLAKKRGMLESVYFFGSSIPSDMIASKKYGGPLQAVVNKRILNYYSPQDDVLRYAHEHNMIDSPIGYLGSKPGTVGKYLQKKVRPKNHRFASYAQVLAKYP